MSMTDAEKLRAVAEWAKWEHWRDDGAPAWINEAHPILSSDGPWVDLDPENTDHMLALAEHAFGYGWECGRYWSGFWWCKPDAPNAWRTDRTTLAAAILAALVRAMEEE